MNRRFPSLAALAFIAGALAVGSCVEKNKSLGEDYIPENQRYDIYTAEFNLDDIEMRHPDSLSGNSLYKITVGAIRDEVFGLTTRSSAFTIVPMADTLDFGDPGTQIFRGFHLSAPLDTISCDDPSQAFILQNLNVYELTSPLDPQSANPRIRYDSSKRISKGIPVLNGADSLLIDFNEDFGKKYMDIKAADMDTITHYTKRFPGIYLTTDKPVGKGGRINMFKLPIDVQSGYIEGAYATLRFRARYGKRGMVDTTFYFYLGPASLYDLNGVTNTTPSTYPQFAYDKTTYETSSLEGKRAEDVIWFEGGRGVKPVVKAAAVREALRAEMSKHGDPSDMIVNKATIEFHFDAPDDYKEFSLFPVQLSPTCAIRTDTSITFAGLSDASAKTENQGDIDRSNLKYAPDLSHHIQELIDLEDLSKISNYDIWFLGMANETVSTSNSSSSSSDMSDYYNYLAYQSYYNNMYSGYGGYGGYGYGGYGYGNYGSYYSNYYNYAMLASMYSNTSSSSTTTKQLMMDTHRFYRIAFHGPKASEGKPKLRITYCVPMAE